VQLSAVAEQLEFSTSAVEKIERRVRVGHGRPIRDAERRLEESTADLGASMAAARRSAAARIDAVEISDRPEADIGRNYWITSSARIVSEGGMVRPSALAARRLTTRRYFRGCSIGNSAGLAPLRILST
jgi:hypothetical protein